jgi:hypothetical protein
MKLILIIITIIIVIYAICYYIFPKDISILQTDITNFNFNLLSSRQPIVITDYIQNPPEIINSWFNYNIINSNLNDNKDLNDDDNNDWIHNNYKYLFINANEDTEVIIYKAEITKINPTPEDKIIIIKLQKNQSLILPFKWKYYSNNINKWGIDDLITFSFGRLF